MSCYGNYGPKKSNTLVLDLEFIDFYTENASFHAKDTVAALLMMASYRFWLFITASVATPVLQCSDGSSFCFVQGGVQLMWCRLLSTIYHPLFRQNFSKTTYSISDDSI